MSPSWRLLCVSVLIFTGCNPQPPSPTAPAATVSPAEYGSGGYGYGTGEITFLDAVATQETPATDFAAVPMTTADGRTITLKDLAAGKPLIAVFTRGYAGSICPYCSSQTSRLIANYAEFQKRDTEVVVIYPLEKPEDTHRLNEFMAKVNENNTQPATQVAPFPMLVDIGLKAVDVLGIRRDLSKPATYILDEQGAVRFAYVGKSLADRPSVKALLEQLDAMKTMPAGG
ncbi:MAG TPA: redoxin domain-containing protein [Planctomycetaceae bacterium]|nr:redoxin domain-containing protein [Planctomycetaceae bacterium]